MEFRRIAYFLLRSTLLTNLWVGLISGAVRVEIGSGVLAGTGILYLNICLIF